MHLWNDYEGATLAGQWKLGKLLRTEGRSALFSTTKPDGRAAVLRLTEALNDQSILAARYRSIQAAGDRFLVKVESFGDAEFDGTPLSYAVLEPTQESLADILATRRLAPEEVQEVATVVAGGLHALHKQGLVHGLVEPTSVLAAGDQIKLRSDCARPAPPSDLDETELEGVVTPKTDAWGLAGILYQSLTQNRLHDAADALALPEPYATIVRNTTRGAWGVPEIEAELARHTRAHAPPAAPAKPASPVEPARPAPPVPAKPAPPVEPVRPAQSTPAAPRTGSTTPPKAPAALTGNPAGEPFSSRAVLEKASAGSPARSADSVQESWQQPERVGGSRRLGIALAVTALVLALIVFGFVHHRAQMPTITPQPTTGAAPNRAPATAAAAKPAPAASAETGIPGPTVQPPQATGAATGHDVWRVVAYTYNHRALAEKKAAYLNQRHPNFKAEVFSPTGNRPFLVTLGGPMLKDQAMELRNLARKTGVARDVYAQNYAR